MFLICALVPLASFTAFSPTVNQRVRDVGNGSHTAWVQTGSPEFAVRNLPESFRRAETVNRVELSLLSLPPSCGHLQQNRENGGTTNVKKKKKRSSTPEQKLAAVKIVQDSGKPVATVAKELGLSVSSLRNWVKRAEVDAGNGPAGVLRLATPALVQGPPGTWDSARTETPDVIHVPSAPEGRQYILAYSGGETLLAGGYYNYRIGIAFSADGVNFERLPAEESPYGEAGMAFAPQDAFPALDGINGGVVADPVLLYKDGLYHLWFSSLACTDGEVCDAGVLAFGIGHATSTDAIHWVASADNPVVVGGEQASVAWDPYDCVFEMWFTLDEDEDKVDIPSTFSAAKGFWRAESPDATTWTIDPVRDFVWDEQEASEDLGLLTGVDVVRVGRELRLFYVGMTTTSLPSDEVYIPVQTWFDDLGFVQGTFGLGFATKPQDQ